MRRLYAVVLALVFSPFVGCSVQVLQVPTDDEVAHWATSFHAEYSNEEEEIICRWWRSDWDRDDDDMTDGIYDSLWNRIGVGSTDVNLMLNKVCVITDQDASD